MSGLFWYSSKPDIELATDRKGIALAVMPRAYLTAKVMAGILEGDFEKGKHIE